MDRNCFEGVVVYTVRRKKTEAKDLLYVYHPSVLSASMGSLGNIYAWEEEAIARGCGCFRSGWSSPRLVGALHIQSVL